MYRNINRALSNNSQQDIYMAYTEQTNIDLLLDNNETVQQIKNDIIDKIRIRIQSNLINQLQKQLKSINR